MGLREIFLRVDEKEKMSRVVTKIPVCREDANKSKNIKAERPSILLSFSIACSFRYIMYKTKTVPINPIHFISIVTDS